MNPLQSRRSGTQFGWCALVVSGWVLASSARGSFAWQEEPQVDPGTRESEQGGADSNQQPIPGSEEVSKGKKIEIAPISVESATRLSDACRPGLASFFMRASRRIMQRPNPEILHIDLAFEYARFAVQADPNRAATWRLLLAMTLANDPDNPGINELEGEALKAISRLDPNDEVILLRRLLWTVEQQDTAEARLDLFSRLLEPASIEVIGEQVAARIALDMAQLMYRTGDSDGFAERLALAIELDPSFPRATAMAAGYFASDDDPLAEGELLLAALLADPAMVGFAVELGDLALANGAFSGASRMLGLARSSAKASDVDSNSLVVQQALALWGERDAGSAVEVIDSRMRSLDQRVRKQVREDDPEVGPVEIAKVHAPLPPSFALLKGAILSEGDDLLEYRTFVAVALADLMKLAESGLDEMTETPASVASASALLLEAAAFAGWQGEDSTAIDQLVEAARGYVDLSEETLARFEAWKAIAAGKDNQAIAILESLDKHDDFSKLALSIALDRSGQSKAAAKLWFQLVRSSRGSIIGIWSRGRLEKALSTRIVPSRIAQELNLLIKEIPSSVDRLLLGRNRAISLRIEPLEPKIQAFSQIQYRLQLANQSGLPLAIGPGGPIRPTIAISSTVTRSTSDGSKVFPWIVMEIDRQLEIEPRGTLERIIDLSDYPMAETAFVVPHTGMSLGIRVVTNFDAVGVSLIPGRLGEKANSRLLRVDGITADAQWRRDSLKKATMLDSLKSIEDLQLMLHVAAQIGGKAQAPQAAYRDMVFKLFTIVYPTMPTAVRAWLVSSSPEESNAPGFDKIIDLFETDTAPLVIRSMLARMTWSVGTTGSLHPYFAIAAESDDSMVASFGEKMKRLWEIAEEEQAASDSIGQ